MKYYESYLNRQKLSQEAHAKLLNLNVQKKSSNRVWAKYGAFAACAALVLSAGVWKLAPRPQTQPDPAQGASQFTADYTPLPGEKDTVDPEDLFVVSSPIEHDKLMFPMVPAIGYQAITDRPEADAARAYYAPGSFMADLTKEDIQTIFWGLEGKPKANHPKTKQGDLPWMLFWDGYTLHGYVWYDGQGQLQELSLYGEQGRAGFQLRLRMGGMPLTCCIDRDRGDEISVFNGVEIAGWSQIYDRDGDGQTDYICGSEFMTGDVGIQFENWNSDFRAEYGDCETMEQGGAATFNALFVRQALTSGLYLEHLMTAESIPAWREETFSSLAQARQETDFAPYLPAKEPEGYSSYTGNKEFYSRLSYQEGTQNMLFVRWSRGYDDITVEVFRDGCRSYDLADPSNPAGYDVRLYEIPWCDSVPEEYRQTVDDPAFKAEDMSLSIVEARGIRKDTGGMRFRFDVLHPDGTLVSYRCDNLTAQQVWEMVEETL